MPGSLQPVPSTCRIPWLAPANAGTGAAMAITGTAHATPWVTLRRLIPLGCCGSISLISNPRPGCDADGGDRRRPGHAARDCATRDAESPRTARAWACSWNPLLPPRIYMVKSHHRPAAPREGMPYPQGRAVGWTTWFPSAWGGISDGLRGLGRSFTYVCVEPGRKAWRQQPVRGIPGTSHRQPSGRGPSPDEEGHQRVHRAGRRAVRRQPDGCVGCGPARPAGRGRRPRRPAVPAETSTREQGDAYAALADRRAPAAAAAARNAATASAGPDDADVAADEPTRARPGDRGQRGRGQPRRDAPGAARAGSGSASAWRDVQQQRDHPGRGLVQPRAGQPARRGRRPRCRRGRRGRRRASARRRPRR